MIAAFLLGVVVGITVLAVCIVLAPSPRSGPRPETRADRADRIDAEAMRATRAASSNRKAGRVSRVPR